jgi:S-DNA-T family DNA segregation ATPase FtsK/SpoIIIE
MGAKTRPVSSGRRRRAPKPSHRTADVAGVLFIALAAVTGIALYTSNAGLVGQAIADFFRLVFGQGAWGVVGVFGLFGLGLILRRQAREASQLGWGLFLLFLTLLGALAQPFSGDYFDPQAASQSGGLLGALVGWALDRLLGDAKPVGLGAIGMVGLILCLQMPLHAILDALASRAAELRLKSSSAKTSKMNGRAVARVPVRDDFDELGEREPPSRERPAPRIKDVTLPGFGEELPSMPKEGYELPPISLLDPIPAKSKRSPQEMAANIETLESTLEEFGIDANVVEVATGPTVTRYEIQLGPGIRVNRITALADNIAMNLAASHVRVEAPIPGKSAIGVEVPNTQPTPVALREMIDSKAFREHPTRLWIALGQDVAGEPRYTDLAKMPHLLIGGATNSGKSIGLASLIMSLIFRNTPKDVRFVLVDPKRVEFTLFDGIPHLMCPVVRDAKQTPAVLRALWREMDRRYDRFSEAGVRNIDGWNQKASFQDKMPYIVVVIDELADLMIQAAAEVETAICRLAQLARATGIHLVVATQRPSVDVITGTIKANISSRVAFAVTSQVDSRTILDGAGAERLIGRGDMLFMPIDASKPVRIQGCYVSEQEVERVCKFWKDQERPHYQIDPAQLVAGDSSDGAGRPDSGMESDPLWEDAVRWVAARGEASTSMLQRKFSIGFQRASRLLDSMEERGIVGARDGPRPREVLMNPHEVESLFVAPMRYDTGPTPDDEGWVN